eukprot:XP_011682442.1 PREDICTED: protein sel-1 homolog 3-like [Strongylocentrotus purpuratus]
MSMIISIKLPLKEWLHMVYVQDGRKWSVQFYTQSSPTSTHLIGRSAFANDVHYNETEAFYHVGGSSAVRSFSGFMLEAKLWRRQALDPTKVPMTPVDKLNYTTGISKYYRECDRLHVSMEMVFNNFKLKHQDKLKKRTCPSIHPFLANNLAAEEPPHLQPSCNSWQQPAPKRQLKLWRLLKQSAAVNNSYAATHEWIGHQLYQHVLERLHTKGLGGMQANIPWLRQASCYGNMDAAGFLATVYNAGLGVQTNESMALIYWLENYQIALETVLDRTKHTESDTFFEAIRLTDEQQLQTQTGETGDYFKWLKYQAKQGVADAQSNIAQHLFWGTHGVKRNVEHAVSYYAETAQTHPMNKIALYDYGIVLLRGQGVEKDEEKGMDYLNKSAALMKAFEYYLKAAKADHWDSGVKVAELYNQGNEQMARDTFMAAAWARYVAEKNRDVAWVLRWGLDAYLKGSWSESLVYYAMAAEAGLEVGQFNLAYLCEENYDGIAERYVDKDCAWKYWKLAAGSTRPHLTST